MHATEPPKLSQTSIPALRSVSQGTLKSRKSEYGSMLFRSDQMVRTVTTAPTASRADIDSLVNKYNLMYEISQAAKRDMTKFKTEVNDLRAEVQSYRSLTDLALEGHRNDLLNELHADFNQLLQEISDEESTRELLVQEVRDLNVEIRHTYRLIRESLLRINGLENFTGVGKLK